MKSSYKWVLTTNDDWLSVIFFKNVCVAYLHIYEDECMSAWLCTCMEAWQNFQCLPGLVSTLFFRVFICCCCYGDDDDVFMHCMMCVCGHLFHDMGLEIEGQFCGISSLSTFAWVPRFKLRYLDSSSHAHLFLKWSLSLKLELLHSARLPGDWTLEIHLSTGSKFISLFLA